MTVGNSKAQMEGFAQDHTAVGSKARFPGSHLGIGSAWPCLLKFTAKPYVPGLSSHRCLALIRESSCLDVLWAFGFVASLRTCLFINSVSRHLVSSWNVPGIVPVTG